MFRCQDPLFSVHDSLMRCVVQNYCGISLILEQHATHNTLDQNKERNR